MSKLVAFLCLVCLVLTALWVGLLVADMAFAGPLETFEQAVAHASRLHGLFYATYINAALLTLAAVALFAALFAWLKPSAPDWAVIGLVFVPIYSALNLVAYLSQVTLIPSLIALRSDPQYAATVDVLLRLALQAWPASAMAFVNGLAYAILGIPSILFGLLLWRQGGALRWGGLLLALGLGKAGHNVTLASHPCMRGLVESYGVTFAPMGPDIDIGHETAVIRGKSPHWMVGFMRVMKFSFAMLEQSHAGLLELCRGADLVVVSHSAAGRMEADKLGLPTVSVTLMPEAIPVKDPPAPFLKRAVMGLAGAGMGLLMTRPIDRIRQRAGLPPMGPTGITSETLNLIPLSPQIVPPNPLWEPRHRMTGYWFAPAPETWTPPVDLAAFLEAGDPPIVVSLGAMALSGEDSLEAVQITLEAAREAGARAIIQGWDETMKQMDVPTTIFHAGSVPHDWLLPRASGLVHHGGFGTTASGFRAGIPMLVIPHIIDQFIWGNKVAQLGVGPQPISRSKLKTENMAAALRTMQSPDLRRTAADLSAAIAPSRMGWRRRCG